jgi:hypothetical protein
MLRAYLRSKGVFNQVPPKDPPTPDVVKAFEEDHVLSVPMLDDPRFDWVNPLTSPWNTELSFRLAQDFKPKLEKVEHLSIPPNMSSTTFIQGVISKKVRRTRQVYLDSCPPALDAPETAMQKEARIKMKKQARSKQDRRVSRRHGVSTDDVRWHKETYLAPRLSGGANASYSSAHQATLHFGGASSESTNYLVPRG